MSRISRLQLADVCKDGTSPSWSNFNLLFQFFPLLFLLEYLIFFLFSYSYNSRYILNISFPSNIEIVSNAKKERKKKKYDNNRNVSFYLKNYENLSDNFNSFHVHIDYFLLVLGYSINLITNLALYRLNSFELSRVQAVLIPNQLPKTVLVKLENKHVLSSSRVFLRSS